MRLDSIRTIKCALAGTATSKFTDVLEAVFGIDEENPPEFEAEEDEPDVVPEEGIITKEAVEGESLSDPVASTSVGVGAKRKIPTSTTTVKSKRKSSKPVKGRVCALVDAIVFYPFDSNTYLHTGVPSKYISKREGSQYKHTAVYMCNYSKVENSRGNQVPPCDTMCQNKSQVSSHVRQFHLGICVACYICGHRWWSATEWKKHMITHHSNLSEQEFFVAPTEAPADLQIKTEVEDIEVDFEKS